MVQLIAFCAQNCRCQLSLDVLHFDCDIILNCTNQLLQKIQRLIFVIFQTKDFPDEIN